MNRRVLLSAAALVAALSPIAPASASDVCGRPCLQGLVDRYLVALSAHDPSLLPLARNVRFTENGIELRLGDGLWGTASGAGHYKLYVVDPEDGQVGFFGTVMENGAPVLMALRLKVTYGLIDEIETIVARGSGAGNFPPAGRTMEAHGHPRPQFLRSVPPAERPPRAELVRIADSYFTGLGGNTGRNTAPFAPTCNRWENGIQTTNNASFRGSSSFNVVALGCDAQQKSGFFSFVTEIRNRRFPVVDRERGLVLGFCFFDHAGKLAEIHLTNGQTVPSPVRSPLTLEVAELFQIDRGKLDQIEAVLGTAPYGMRSAVWDSP